jgi:hypothetical protein
MKLEISFNKEKDGVELLFSEQLPEKLTARLTVLGFKKGFVVPLKWTAKSHPAYVTYAGELKEALLKNRDYLSVDIHPSFTPSEENIDHNKFSYVTISYQDDEQKRQSNFIVFDTYKKVAEAVAHQYGKHHYKKILSVDVVPRKYKRKARQLFSEGKVITDSEHVVQPQEQEEMTWVVYASNGKIDSLQISEEKAKAYIGRRPEFSRDKMRYEEMEKQQAFDLWDQQKKEEEQSETPFVPQDNQQESFNAAGFEVIDEKREISPLYHGTCVPFNQFEKQFLGLKSGDIPSHLGHHFTPSKKLASTIFANDPYEESYKHCRYIQVALKVKKTLKTTEEALVKTILKWGIDKKIIDKKQKELEALLKLPYMGDERKEKTLITELESDTWKSKGDSLINYEVLAIRYLNEVLKPQGFDSILYQNGIEWAHEKRYDWIVFDNNQIVEQDIIYIHQKQTPGEIAQNLLDSLTDLEMDADEEESDVALLSEVRLALDEAISTKDDIKIIIELKRVIEELKNTEIQTELIRKEVKKTATTAEKLLTLLSVKDVKQSTDKLTNKNGGYTEETAGKNYESIAIPIPKNAKYEAIIKIVKDEDNLYRMATDTHKQFGDFSGHSSPITDQTKTHQTKDEALEVALKEIVERIQKEVKSRDSILDNESKKAKMLNMALKAVESFAEQKGLVISENQEIKKETTKTTYRLGQGWSNLGEKIIADFEQLINNHIDQLEVTPEPGYLDIEENSNSRIASATLQSDRDKIHFQTYRDNTLLISSLTPFDEGVTYGGSTMPKTKLKKAIQYMLQHPELLGGEKSKNDNGIIIKKLEATLWQQEDDAYPVNQVMIKGVAYHQSRLRELLLDELNSQPLAYQLELIETLGSLFKERRPYTGNKKQVDALSKAEEKKEKAMIRSYVDDIIIDHDLWQIKAADGEVKQMENGVMAWLINRLFQAADTLVDKPTKPKQMAKKTTKTSQHELNVMIEDFIVEKDSEDHVYTEEDKNYLKQYTGGGGLIKQGAKGKGILYEYFTPDEIVQKMWGLAIKYGYKGGDVLEPSCGIGNFIKYATADAKVVGYEINPYSNRIAEILYPQATIYQQPFETLFFAGNVHLKDDFGDTRYDLVIGNPPYGEFLGKWAGMGEKKWTGATEYDQYFITRGLDLLRKDGLLIFIIPSSFLSNASKYNKLKEKIAAKAELIDAYRLPERVFKTTDIGTDIVVFRKL